MRLVVLAAALFLAASGFMLFLSSGMLAELSRGLHLSGYRQLGERQRLSIERGLRFGRPLAGYAGLREQLENAKSAADGLLGIMVVDAGNALIARAGAGLSGDALPVAPSADGDGADWLEVEGRLALFLPLAGRDGRVEGHLVLLADSERVRLEQERFWRISLLALACLTLMLIPGLYGWAAGVAALPGEQRPKRRYWLCLFFAGGGLVVYAAVLMWFFVEAHSAAENAKIAVTAKSAVWDLERLLGKGVRFDQVRGIQTYFSEIRRENPEILAIRLSEENRPVIAGGTPPTTPPDDSRPIAVYWPDRHTPWRETARLEFWMNPAGVRDALWAIGRTLATALLVSFFLINELARARIPSGSAGADAAAEAGAVGNVARLVAFAFFFAYDLVLSFVPLHVALLPGDVWSLPKSIVQALPVTLEASAVGVGILLAGLRLREIGLAARLRAGIALAVMGLLASWLAADIALFCAARFLAGLGMGLFLMSSQFVLLENDGRAKSIGELYSGVLSGSLCGVAGGAMAAELLGFGRIFLISCLALVLVFFLAGYGFASASENAAAGRRATVILHRTSLRRLLGFFLSFPFLGQALLVAFPAAVVLSGVMFYSLPVVLERTGLAQGDIGRIFMLYGLTVIVAGPILGRLADAGKNYARWIALAGAASAFAALFIREFPSPAGYALAAVASGVAFANLAASGMTRVTDLAESREVAAGAAGGVYRFVERFGQMLGPVLFGFLVGDGGGNIIWVFLAVLAGAALFFLGRNVGAARNGNG